MPEPLTREAVLKVAKLSRLRLSPERVETLRGQLSGVLDYIAQIAELDVSNVEPMAHPTDQFNRLAEDEVGESLTVEQVLHNAPETKGPFIVVPKVLGAGGEGGGA